MTFIITSTTSLIYTLWQNLNISYSKLEDYASSLEEKVNEKTQDLIHKQQALELQNIQLLEARKIAENANKAKSNFLASMSHELRTPLNAIIGYSELLVEEAEDTGEVELINDLNKIKNSGVHLLGLINDILDLSKIEAGKTTLDENQCNLSHVLESIKEILVIKAEEKNLSFVLNIDKNIPQCILTDEKRIKQILINLLNNSIKFTKQGSVGLKVYLPQETENILDSKKENYQKVFFEVTDTGAGIKKEELYKLFEPFEQTETGKNAAESTGLGLTISKKLINLLGGDIWVESEVNKGTTFTFYIQAKDIVRSHLKNLHHD
jgi:signal transduction histidine kinase